METTEVPENRSWRKTFALQAALIVVVAFSAMFALLWPVGWLLGMRFGDYCGGFADGLVNGAIISVVACPVFYLIGRKMA